MNKHQPRVCYNVGSIDGTPCDSIIIHRRVSKNLETICFASTRLYLKRIYKFHEVTFICIKYVFSQLTSFDIDLSTSVSLSLSLFLLVHSCIFNFFLWGSSLQHLRSVQFFPFSAYTHPLHSALSSSSLQVLLLFLWKQHSQPWLRSCPTLLLPPLLPLTLQFSPEGDGQDLGTLPFSNIHQQHSLSTSF